MADKLQRNNSILPNRSKLWRSLPAFAEPPTDNADLLHAYQERVQFLAQILEYSSQPFSVVTPEGEILDCNPAFLDLVGYTKEELSHISWDKGLTPAEWYEVQNYHLSELQRAGVPVRYEKEYLTKDGRRISVELLVHQFIDLESGKRHYYSFITDISSRKKAEAAQWEAEKALRQSEERYRNILESIDDGYFEVDTHGNFTFSNNSLSEVLGYPKQDLFNMSYRQYMDSNNARKVFRAFNKVFRTRESTKGVDWQTTLPDGSKMYSEASVSAILDQGGKVCGFRGTVRDVSQRKEAEEALRRSESKYRLVFENSPLGILHFDRQGRITACNERLSQIVGPVNKEFLIGFNLLNLPEADLSNAVQQTLNGQKSYFQGNLRSMITGKATPIEAQIAPMSSDEGDPLGGVVIVSDITERKHYEETIQHLAYHDALTGLPNRLLINDRINNSLSQARRQQQMLALIYLDLDDFKMVNDNLGHLVGDRLLQEVAKRLKSLVREGDTVSRMGGDEFMFLFPGLYKIQDAKKIADKILDSFASPYQVDGNEIHVTASIGLSIFPNDGEDGESLIKNADSALYRAKDQGRNNYQIFNPAMNEAFLERITITNELRQALEHEDLILYYQPLIEIKSGQIVCMEALVRWQHPRNGLVLPEKFIHVAEETGLIIPLDKWALLTACRQNKQWQDSGLPAIRMAVNISGRHFWKHDLVEIVAGALDETGLEPKYLELEITESIAIQNLDRVSEVLRELRKLGIQIALDDFGTGYSSLSYLRNLPIDSLKIDQSFIRELGREAAGSAIPQALIALARDLDLKVTAEGVEDPEQLELLYNLQCAQVQGFLVCRPQPAHCIYQLLAQTGRVIYQIAPELKGWAPTTK